MFLENQDSNQESFKADEILIANKLKMDEEDAKYSIKMAKEKLKIHKDKLQQNIPLGKRIRVRPIDRSYLMEIVSNQIFNDEVIVFPTDAEWKTIWNRFMDTQTNEEQKRKLLNIEKDIFLNIKQEVEDLFEQKWSGSAQENNMADFKIALSIKQSFRSYEKDTAKSKTYFKFTKD